MRNFARMGLKLLAIYFLVRFLQYLLSSIGSIGFILTKSSPSFLELFFMVLPLILYISLFYLLWYNSEELSKSIIKEDEKVVIDSNFNFEKLQRVLFSFLGIYLIFNSIAGLGRDILNFIMSSSMQLNAGNTYIPEMIENIIFLLFGLILITKVEIIINIIKRSFSNIEQE